MSSLGPGDDRWDEPGDDFDDVESRSWPLDWRSLYPRERWMWFEQLWTDACMLRERYRLALRAGWWEDQVQVEALAAFAAWVHLYDCGDWTDPPGGWPSYCATERTRFIPTAIGLPSPATCSSSDASHRRPELRRSRDAILNR